MHLISVMFTIKGKKYCFDGIQEICDFYQNNVIFVPKKIIFCQKCSLSIKKRKNENRISFWPSVKRTWQILYIPVWTFLLFNGICIGICNSLLDLIFKK